MSETHAAVRVELYEPAAKDLWDEFIRGAKNSNFLFLRDYMEYHRHRFTDHSLMFYQGGELVGCLPAHRNGEVLSSHQGLTFGGMIVNHKVRLAEMMDMLETLRVYMKAEGLRELLYRAIPYPYHSVPAEEDIYALHRLGARVVDVKPACLTRVGRPPHKMRDRRRELTKAHRSNIKVERDFDFAGFMNLCEQELRARHQASPVHRVEEMQYLAAKFPHNIELYTVRNDGALEAGILIYRNPLCCRAQYSATTEQGRKAGAHTVIVDHLLTKVLTAGTWYDAGHAIDPATGSLNESLMYYKESLGGRTVAQMTYSMAID